MLGRIESKIKIYSLVNNNLILPSLKSRTNRQLALAMKSN